jgi:zinc and cadmium transporter
MSTLLWILFFGVLMSCISLVGGVTLFLKQATLERIQLPLVAFAAGSLIGGALFHMIPSAVNEMNNSLALYVWLAAGFLLFLALEQFLDWHHSHSHSPNQRKPLTYLILFADGLHHFADGLFVAASFMTDFQLGVVAWIAAAAHELPQELGDFAILIQGGWSKSRALTYNFLSALSFVAGGLVVYAMSAQMEFTFLIPFAAGNFLYIGAADLIPEIKIGHELHNNILHFLSFASGLGWLLALRFVFPH